MIKLNTTIPLQIIDNENIEVFYINNTKCYIDHLSDTNLIQIYFSHNNNFYTFSHSDKQILLDIIKNLEEQE